MVMLQGIDFLPGCDCDCDYDVADTVYSQPWSLRILLRYDDLNATRHSSALNGHMALVIVNCPGGKGGDD